MRKKDTTPSDRAQEPMALYLSAAPFSRLLDALSSKGDHRALFTDRLSLVTAIRQGIPSRVFAKLKALLPFSDADWSDFLGISLKSMQRYKQDKDHLFRPIHSEKIIELTEVVALGQDVFADKEAFAKWLKEPSVALGGLKPYDLLHDSYGQSLVIDELNAIDQGIFA